MFWVSGWGTCPIRREIGNQGAFRFWGVHPGGGSPQSPPMPEKLTNSQVNPLSAWSTGCDGLGARKLGGSWCERVEIALWRHQEGVECLRRRARSLRGDGNGWPWDGLCTWCNHRTIGRSRIPIQPSWIFVGVVWSNEEASAATIEWTMSNGIAFSCLTGGSSIPYVLILRASYLLNPTWDWESGGFRGLGSQSRRWISAISPHAWETDSFPSRRTRRLEYWMWRTQCS